MPEIKKRETAYKIRIGDLLRGNQIFDEKLVEGQAQKKLLFVDLGDKKLVRVNILANVIDKYTSEGERHFASLTMDDGSGQIRIRVFGEDINKFNDITQGDTLMILGVLRSFNNELYILPEILRKIDPRYLLIRKLEIEKAVPKEVSKEIKAFRDQIISLIKQAEAMQVINTEDILNKVQGHANIISEEIKKLLEEGVIYEPRPGRVRYLG